MFLVADASESGRVDAELNLTLTFLTIMDKKTASPVASPKGKSSGPKGLKKGFLLRTYAFGIMVEGDTSRTHHESACTLGSKDCTNCSYDCIESDIFLDGFNVDEAIH